MRRLIVAVLLIASAAMASQPGEPTGNPKHEIDRRNGNTRHAKDVAKDALDSGDPQIPQGGGNNRGLVKKEQLHAGSGQEQSATKQNPQNQDHAQPQDGAWQWKTLSNLIALAALLCNIPTWIIGVRYGRRQSKAAEDANTIAREALAAQNRVDVRWVGLALVYTAISDGKNKFTCTLRNFSAQPVTIESAEFSAAVGGVAAIVGIADGLHGVLGAGESGQVAIECIFPAGTGDEAFRNTARIAITCIANFNCDGSRHSSSARFKFDNSSYSFRLSGST